MKELTFRLRGVRNALSQTLLDNARCGLTRITHVATDAQATTCFVKVSTQTGYIPLGEIPEKHRADVKAVIRRPYCSVKANVLGGGWSIYIPGLVNREIARYGDNDSILPHHAVAVAQGDYMAMRLNMGLEITFLVGLPEPE